MTYEKTILYYWIMTKAPFDIPVVSTISFIVTSLKPFFVKSVREESKIYSLDWLITDSLAGNIYSFKSTRHMFILSPFLENQNYSFGSSLTVRYCAMFSTNWLYFKNPTHHLWIPAKNYYSFLAPWVLSMDWYLAFISSFLHKKSIWLIIFSGHFFLHLASVSANQCFFILTENFLKFICRSDYQPVFLSDRFYTALYLLR